MPPHDTPRWRPATEADIAQAIAAQLLEETHFLDYKADVERTRGGNNELARDMAQFAIDAGALLIGVAEDDAKKPVLAPLDVTGLPERIEQVALSIDPPLLVSTRVITSDQDPALGYVWVDIPASSVAPHQVGGVYYGRGDKTKRRLSDVEVRRIHTQQAASEQAGVNEVNAYVDRDPVPAEQRKHAHLFIVAVPATPRPEMLLDAVSGPDRHLVLHDIIRHGTAAAPSTDRFSPSLWDAGSFAQRSDGAAMTSGALGTNRTLDMSGYDAESFIEVEISDEGTVRVMTGRFSGTLDDNEVLFETMLPVLTRQTIDIAGKVAEHANYGGAWHFAIVATGIAGLPAHLRGRSYAHAGRHVGADTDRYERATTASTHEVLEEPWGVAQRLAGRFVRSLGIETNQHVLEVLDAPTT